MRIKSKVQFAEGTIHDSNTSGKFEIVEFKNPREITIRFVNTGYVMTTQASPLKLGVAKDKLAPTILRVACLGVGGHAPAVGKPAKATLAYSRWYSMLARCYDPGANGYASCGAKGVKVCKEWLNFQNFAEWLDQHKPAKGDFELNRDKESIRFDPTTCVVNNLLN